MKKQAPKYALNFLRWYCREDFIDEIEGDLIELFENQYTASPKQANWFFIWQVLLHFRPDFIKSFKTNPFIHMGMYKHYFKITWRSLLKQKLYAFINIGGLAIGLTSFILIFLYIQHELSYDRFLDNADRIYRVYQKMPGNEYLGTDFYAYTTVGLAPALMQDYPEVLHATTIRDQTALLSYNESHYYEDGMRADAHFFDVFQHPFIQGNPKTALAAAESIVLTESLAQKIFGRKDPIGQALIYHDQTAFTVTGVIKDPPINSSLKFAFLTPMLSSQQYVEEIKGNQWNNNDYYTFFTLAEGTNPLAFEDKLPGLLEKYWPDYHNFPFPFSYLVQPLSELHFETNLNFDIGLKGNAKYISLFSLIAVLVLLLACANYMNLAIARSIKRAGEVGLRKVVGARQGQLIGQFLGESTFITFLALLLALGLTYLLLPSFGHLMERTIVLDVIENTFLLPSLLLLVILVGMLSGSYPAFLMSTLRPIQVLKGKIEGRFSGISLQRWLMVGQYAVSIVLIISSLVIYRQFQFIQNRDLGYNKAQVVTIPVLDYRLREKIDELKNEWSQNPGIVSVTTAAELPTNVTSGTLLRHIHEDDKSEGLSIYRARHGYNYLDVFGIDLLSGRDYSPDIKTDFEESLLINETAARALGWTAEEAVGKTVKDHQKRTIIGVVKDFHMHSMHLKIAPLMLPMESYFAEIAVKVRSEHLEETIASLEKSIKQYSPYPFQYQFLDERFGQLYKADLRLGEMFGFFTVLSILIASLGLFGMAAFIATQRTKEIGIRKVLGASVNNIMGMLSKDFLKMVLLGFFVAIPIAWYAMHLWLEDFAYRIEMKWWMFAIAGAGAILIAFFTVSFQSLKVAIANPVNALKNE